ncbi:MAG: hypothetical protein KY456_02685 [Chloroflexi bacterium]|nr:hypothetical protein [Chloroflexota bacterium]
MAKSRRREGLGFIRSAAIVLVALGLTACGESIEPATQITPPVPFTPTAGEIPEDTFQATATITDEGLEPDRFAGQVGTAFRLIVEGDGAEHTLVIEELVAETPIAAEGQTIIDFTVVGDPGLLDILLDGEVAGTFERQSASGATEDG